MPLHQAGPTNQQLTLVPAACPTSPQPAQHAYSRLSRCTRLDQQTTGLGCLCTRLGHRTNILPRRQQPALQAHTMPNKPAVCAANAPDLTDRPRCLCTRLGQRTNILPRRQQPALQTHSLPNTPTAGLPNALDPCLGQAAEHHRFTRQHKSKEFLKNANAGEECGNKKT